MYYASKIVLPTENYSTDQNLETQFNGGAKNHLNWQDVQEKADNTIHTKSSRRQRIAGLHCKYPCILNKKK